MRKDRARCRVRPKSAERREASSTTWVAMAGPTGPVLKLLTEWFGGYEAWLAEFTKMANGLAGGSGWVILYNLHTGEVHN